MMPSASGSVPAGWASKSSRTRRPEPSALGVAQEVGGLAEALLEEAAHVAGEAACVHGPVHAAQPRVAHGGVHGDVAMAHAQARVAVALHVVLRSAQPADEEQAEALAGAAAHRAVRLQ